MIGRLVRHFLEKRDYVLWKRDFIRFGVDPLRDVRRLGRLWDRPLGVVFDVGANAGQFQNEVRSVFPDIDIHSFEPHPASFARIEAAVGPRTRPHRLALGDKAGTLPFYVYGTSREGSLMNSLTPDAGFARRGGLTPEVIEVECLTLDAFCEREGIDHIGLLKVDTEGFDLSVMKGAERMLREGRIDFVYTEFNDLFDRPGVVGGSLAPIAQFLGQFGLRYVCTYTDFVKTDGPMWVLANALFARDPKAGLAN